MNKTNITKVFEIFQQNNPEPRTELLFTTPFELLIAVILSAQATDKSVNKATSTLFSIANTPEKIITLGEEKLKHLIKTIGLFNTKAKNIIRTCHQLIEKHQSSVPRTRKELEDLPGVGRKTANVILNTAFGECTIAVDTHIFRVSNRIGLASGKNVLSVEKELLHRIPQSFKKNAHHWLILHGRYICTARNPKCLQCAIQLYCDYHRKKIL